MFIDTFSTIDILDNISIFIKENYITVPFCF